MIAMCIKKKQIPTLFNIKVVYIILQYTYRRNTLQNPKRKDRETLRFVFGTRTCSSTGLE